MESRIAECNRRIAKYDHNIYLCRVWRRRLLTILITLLIVAPFILQLTFINCRYAEWKDSRHITEVEVSAYDTLDEFGYQYKPEWMDIREYRQYILDLNGIISSDLYIGQHLKLYVVGTEYTVQGHCADNTITTADGNIWTYTEAPNGCVYITFNDNGTPNNIYDDIITDVTLIH